MLFVHGKHEHGEHDCHHQQHGIAHADIFFGEKKRGQAHRCGNGKTNKLPFGKVKQQLGFDITKVFGDWDIRH